MFHSVQIGAQSVLERMKVELGLTWDPQSKLMRFGPLGRAPRAET